MSSDLVAFIEARLSEDFHLARQAAWHGNGAPWIYHSWVDGVSGPEATLVVSDRHVGIGLFEDDPLRPEEAEHIARHDPARVLREVEAKRRLLAYAVGLEDKALDGNWWSLDTALPLKLLALPYADHADYRAEWSP